jgi:hypothetical protein
MIPQIVNTLINVMVLIGNLALWYGLMCSPFIIWIVLLKRKLKKLESSGY